MKQLIFFTLLVSTLIGKGQNNFYAKDISIPITKLDSNIVWGKTIYRVLDFDDKKYSVTLKGKKEELVESLVKSVKEGRDTAYYCKKQLEPEMMDSLRVRIGRLYDMNASFRKFEYSDVGSVIIVENWYYLKKEQIIQKHFVALCLILDYRKGITAADPKNDNNPFDYWERGVFWIY